MGKKAERLVEKIQAELDHAFFNGHMLDPNSGNGVNPFEKTPGVRVTSIEAAIEGWRRETNSPRPTKEGDIVDDTGHVYGNVHHGRILRLPIEE